MAELESEDPNISFLVRLSIKFVFKIMNSNSTKLACICGRAIMKLFPIKLIFSSLLTSFSIIFILFLLISDNEYSSDVSSISYVDSKDTDVLPDRIFGNDNVVSSRFPDFSRYAPPIMDFPTSNYPKYEPLSKLLLDWNPDIPDPPPDFRETLQSFDYNNQSQLTIAQRYRDSELPFKIFGVPEFLHVSNKWTDEYLAKMFRITSTTHVEKSNSNHFMYWKMVRGKVDLNYKPPTELVYNMDFPEWLKRAKYADKMKINSSAEHFYFMTGSKAFDPSSSFVSKDLKLFSTPTENFFITNVQANKGIQCRFGMRGIIAESHYDTGKWTLMNTHLTREIVRGIYLSK